MNTVLGAYTSFLQLLNSDNLANVLGFLNGSLSGRSWGHVETVAIYVSIGTVLAFLPYAGLTSCSLVMTWREAWRRCEQDPHPAFRLRRLFGGGYGCCRRYDWFCWPCRAHMARMLVGPNYKDLVPVAAVMGSVTLLLADTVGRMLVPGHGDPVGVIMAMTGGPFFLYMLRRKRF